MHLSLDTTNQEKEETYDKETLPPPLPHSICMSDICTFAVVFYKKSVMRNRHIKMNDKCTCKDLLGNIFLLSKQKQTSGWRVLYSVSTRANGENMYVPKVTFSAYYESGMSLLRSLSHFLLPACACLMNGGGSSKAF